MSTIKFGTGGWRACIGDEFIKENIEKVASAIATMAYQDCKRDKPIIIGYDNRFLSEEAAMWSACIIASHGIKVIYITQPVPTPLVMHYVQKHNLHFGIEITASHNPYNYNGIKLFVEEGRDAPIEITNRIEKIINTPQGHLTPMSFEDAIKYQWIEIISNPWNDFISDILAVLDIDLIKKRNLSILIDPMNGSGYIPLSIILNSTYCSVNAIHQERDAYFSNRTPAPSPITLKELQLKVVEGGYDLGIALDGDGDRLGIIDSNGRYISANEILCLLYYYLVQYKGWQGPVVRNYATTHMLDRIAENFGEKCYEVPIGFKHISSKIDEVNAVLGGESSGGLTVRGHIHGKDSIYAASLFVEMVCAIENTPSSIIDTLKQKYGAYEMVEENVKYEDRKAIEKKLTLNDLPKFNIEIEKISDVDGRKIYFKNGDWVICRLSGTEPTLRIFAESKNIETAQLYIDSYKKFLEGC